MFEDVALWIGDANRYLYSVSPFLWLLVLGVVNIVAYCIVSDVWTMLFKEKKLSALGNTIMASMLNDRDSWKVSLAKNGDDSQAIFRRLHLHGDRDESFQIFIAGRYENTIHAWEAPGKNEELSQYLEDFEVVRIIAEARAIYNTLTKRVEDAEAAKRLQSVKTILSQPNLEDKDGKGS